MLIHQDDPKRGFEPVGRWGVPCLSSGWWAGCQRGLGWLLTPKAPGSVFPGGNSAIPEEQKEEEEEAEGAPVMSCWKEVPVSPG